jgi:endonuclease I
MKKNYCLLWLLLLAFVSQAQPPGYYSTATGTGYTLKTQLYNIIKNHTAVPYGSLYSCYQGTYNGNATDKKANGKVWDMYSDIPNGTPPYEFNWGQTCGSYSNEGDCFNREHSFPQSWFNSNSPMQSDLFHVYPTDGKVNGIRSNFPYGTVANPTKITQNGSKLGPCSFPGYTGTVFEPRDEYKGDFARTYFYMATRYENLIAGWQNNGNADNVLNGTSTQVFDTWQLNLLYQWHIQDPVSQKEIDRNNAVYSIQNNRNPYIDHPEWVAVVWGFGPISPTVSFASGTGTIQEPVSGTLTYTLNVLVNTTANNPFTVNVSVDGAGSTATSPSDYTFSNTSVTFTGSETSKTIQVTINADAETEVDETLRLVLSSPTNGVALGSPQAHVLTIRDVSAATTVTETFDPCTNLNTWKAFSVTGAQVWGCTNNGFGGTRGAQMNGFSGGAQNNEDWLISPPQTVTATSKMSYRSKADFSGPMLELFVSSNYSGTGTPTAATWTKINTATFATPSGTNSGTWVYTENLDISAYAGPNRYFAFKYTSTTGTNTAARWTLDDISFSGNTAPPITPPALAVTGTLNDFGTVSVGQTSATQTFTVSGSNLTGDVAVEAPQGFEVSKNGTNFSQSIIFVAGTDFTLPTMTPKTVYVRFRPTSGIDGPKDDDIAISSPLASAIFLNVIGTETGNGAAFIQFAEATSSVIEGNNKITLLNISPAVQRLSFVKVKLQLVGGISFDDFTITPNINAEDSTVTVNIPPNSNVTSFIVSSKTDTQENEANEAIEFSIVGTGAGLTAAGQITHKLNFDETVAALNGYTIENTVFYPNPATENIFIKTPLENYELELTDTFGKIIRKERNIRTLAINDLSNGVYFVKIHTSQGTFAKKIIVKR